MRKINVKTIVAASWLFLLVSVLAAAADVASKAIVFNALGVYAEDGNLFDGRGRPFVQKRSIKDEFGRETIEPVLVRELPVIPVIGKKFFVLTPALNLGGMWGFLFGRTFTLVIFSIACIGVIGYMVAKLEPGRHIMRAALALILGGAVGNLYDRLVYGGVRDFLDFDLGFLHWATFNLADVWIVVGVFAIFIMEFFTRRPLSKLNG